MIHHSAYIDPSAQVDSSVKIGPFAYIGPSCKLNKNVIIGAKATVEKNTEIGAATVLSPNAHVGGDPQDSGYKGEDTWLTIGENNVIREFSTINRATTKESLTTVVGNNNYLMSYAHIAHDCRVGNGVVIANASMMAGHIEIGDYAIISGLVGAHQHVRIGSVAMVSGVCRLGKDVPPFCIALNDSIVGLNFVGMKRRGISVAVRNELKKALGIFTDKRLSLHQALKEIENLEPFAEVKEFIDFMGNSKRGIIRNLGYSLSKE